MLVSLTKAEVQNILLWASHYQILAEETSVPLEEDELRMINKLKVIRDKFMEV